MGGDEDRRPRLDFQAIGDARLGVFRRTRLLDDLSRLAVAVVM